MRLLRRTTIPQRVVLVVASGLLLAIGWSWWYLDELLQPGRGWFAYAPHRQETSTYFVVAERRIELLVVPVALVLLWAAASLWLLGLRDDDGPTRRGDPS